VHRVYLEQAFIDKVYLRDILMGIYYIENNFILNSTLVITAMAVDILWYVVLTLLVTMFDFKKFFAQKKTLINKIVGFLFILISTVLMINLFI